MCKAAHTTYCDTPTGEIIDETSETKFGSSLQSGMYKPIYFTVNYADYNKSVQCKIASVKKTEENNTPNNTFRGG